jgi:hypothetical protein
MDELRIRTARAEGVGVLAALMTDLGYPSSVEDMGRRFEGISADPSYATLVAEREGVVLGTIGLPEFCTPVTNIPTLTVTAVK